MTMFQGRIASMAVLLLVGAAPFGAAEHICKSQSNTWTVKVDLFASELGTFVRIFISQPTTVSSRRVSYLLTSAFFR
jgi:hypothetical protein